MRKKLFPLGLCILLFAVSNNHQSKASIAVRIPLLTQLPMEAFGLFPAAVFIKF